MSTSIGIKNNSDMKQFPKCKINTLESSLQSTITQFKDLVIEFEELYLENENYRTLLSQNEKSNISSCVTCEDLKKEIANKENLLKSIVSELQKLSDTQNLKILEPIFHILQTQSIELCTNKDKSNEIKQELLDISSPNDEICNNNDESVSEIEGTLIGRKSPIIFSKKKSSSHSLSLKDKKKCPESWPTPEKKSIKLTFPTPIKGAKGTSSRLKQARLNLVRVKPTNIVDLTLSSETIVRSHNENKLQLNVKREVIDNDDTILPSPTSGPIFQPICKSLAKESPNKCKKPFTSKLKIEADEENMPFTSDIDIKKNEDSINILQHYPKLIAPVKEVTSNAETNCPDESMSLLQRVNIARMKQQNISPRKCPLLENINITNTEPREAEASESILKGDIKPVEIEKRTKLNMEPVYKEPAVRKKAEKRALPGWSCDECEQFYADLYKDDPEVLARKMQECSRHRGRVDPARAARPDTPRGFWHPRWDVPSDTEEFNRRNDAL